MAELPKIAEEAVKKIDTKLECSICFEPFKEPKLLPCFHIFCKSPCLEKLVVQGREGKSLTCPTCRHLVPLPDNGVAGLQTDFHIEHLFEIRESLEKAKKTDCENCTDSPATKYCKDCRMLACEKCTEAHLKWKLNASHQILDITEVKGDATSVLAPIKQIPKCVKHPKMELKIYCETCSELICGDCTIRLHRDHNYDLVDDVIHKHREELLASLRPIKEKLDIVQQALKAFDTKAKEINDQRATVETDINREIDQLHRLLDQRRVELVASLDLYTQKKLKELATQRDHVEMAHARMSSCLEYAEGTLETGTEGEVLTMKAPVLKRIEQITAEFDPDTIQPQTEADIELVTNEIDKACQEYGEVACDPVSAENSYATGDGTKFATANDQTSVEVHGLTKRNKKCEDKLNLTAALVHTETRATIKCEVRQENGPHTITYKPVSRGKHSLHIRVNKKHIQGSPYPIAVSRSLESLRKPIRVAKGLNTPYQVATNSKGHMVVVHYQVNSISVLTPEGEKIFSFGTEGRKEEGQFYRPTGVAVDQDDNMYVVDFGNHRIQKFSPDGKFVAAVGTRGTGNLQFINPLGICHNPKNNKLYVCDRMNHRVQVLSTDLTFEKSFGKAGNENGQFNTVEYAAFDDSNDLYVTDRCNNRVQVFTADGDFLRAFANKANGEEIQHPYAIAIDSSNTVYVSELNGNCVIVFTSQGEYITSFGTKGTERGQFSGVYGLSIDQNDSIIVSDCLNHRLQVF